MMKKGLLNKNRICSIVCIVLLVAVMAAQFLPYWHGEFIEKSVQNGVNVSVTDTSVSIASYVWLPLEHAAFNEWLISTVATGVEFDLNDFVFVPVLQMLISLIGIVALVIKFGKYQASFLTGISGILGLVGFLTSPYLKLGSLWFLFVAIDVLLIAACVVTFVIGIIEKRKNRIV